MRVRRSEALSVDERATMTNMAAEIGGFTGIVAPDKRRWTSWSSAAVWIRKKGEALIEGLYSDPKAQYAHVIELGRGRDYAHGRDSGRSGERANMFEI